MSDRGLFEPDVLSAEQFVAARRRNTTLSSEKRLMLAVLANALDDYQKYAVATDRVGTELFADAAAWIDWTGTQHAFTFESITEALDINPAYLRRGLAAWRDRALAAQRRCGGGAMGDFADVQAVAS